MLTYEETSKLINGLSKHYRTKLEHSFLHGDVFSVYYKNKPVCDLSVINMYELYTVDAWRTSLKLPFGNKLWMILSELVMTPLDKRNGHKFNVVVGKCDIDYNSNMPRRCVVWAKSQSHDNYFYLSTVNHADLGEDNFTFSESEYVKLICFIKRLPDGNTQAKIAELGKQAVVL